MCVSRRMYLSWVSTNPWSLYWRRLEGRIFSATIVQPREPGSVSLGLRVPR